VLGVITLSPTRRFSHISFSKSKISHTQTQQSEQIDTASKMASDDDYMAFLNKANEDPSAGTSKSASEDKKAEFKTMDEDVDVPGVLVRATKDAWYVSDADERFVVVALRYEGGKLPDEGMFIFLFSSSSFPFIVSYLFVYRSMDGQMYRYTEESILTKTHTQKHSQPS
jgi:hypothetical protein